MEFLLCSMTSLSEVTQGLHNHVWIFILIRMLPIVSIAVLLFLFKTTLVPFFLSSLSFLFFFLSQDFLRTRNGNDQDRCIDTYFSRKNFQPKVNSKHRTLLQEMD